MANSESVIRTEGLGKIYKRWFHPGFPALSDLSIEVPRGSVFGFLGPNGAGKTTTIKILMDLIKSTSGRAFVLGKNSWDVGVKEKIGFLPDSPAFPPQLTAREFLNIMGKLLRIPSGDRAARIDEVLGEVKMTEHADEKVGGFSRGMMQRIGVAQALLNHPELLILDEPLLGLDPFGRQEFKEIILTQQKHGTSVFFSSHILSDVEEICDRVAILNRGRLLKTGRLDELLAGDGVRVVIAPGHDDVFRDLGADAVGITRNADGTRVLSFDTAEPVRDRIERWQRECPGAVTVEAGHEKLEDYFFRVLEKHNSQPAPATDSEK